MNRQLDDQWALPFRSSPFRLRFELGGDAPNIKEPVPRFLRALNRARTVAQDAFSSSKGVLAISGCWPYSDRDLFASGSEGFDALRQAGFSATPMGEWKGPHPIHSPSDADEWQKGATWRVFDLTKNAADRDVIIWCALAYEMSIHPKAPVTSFLVDFERGILAYVYDDRGMDVTALERDTLLEIYQTRNDWLLRYDKDRIVEAFGLAA